MAWSLWASRLERRKYSRTVEKTKRSGTMPISRRGAGMHVRMIMALHRTQTMMPASKEVGLGLGLGLGLA